MPVESRREPTPEELYKDSLSKYLAAIEPPPGSSFDGQQVLTTFHSMTSALTARVEGTPEDKAAELWELARKGAAIAAVRAYDFHTQDELEKSADAYGVASGGYVNIGTRITHAESHGAPDTSHSVYRRPDGSIFKTEGSAIIVGYVGTKKMYQPFSILPHEPRKHHVLTTAPTK